ncbi:hypothetical protein FVEG_10068 [Fusarium verticillioides 7600]|uniref:Uncharacterized protein n=1 Tax=Gibberella moniliformis (strain M3125 / FGSC 7600) TaxID=334819 RepID=W7MGY3_GIBM7|nr:hypothetical protein FVEG_10068 [Fusarium verticillioides 7600]EWG50953.1 hypothetical protein FVEG_10068 [Fusarium verticillioides 7600]RBQ73790.1 hypothetical protein FVER14953_10068 [Fusarium verticillioides]
MRQSPVPGLSSRCSFIEILVIVLTVFSPRCDHYWLEIIAASREEADAEAADQWALDLQRELMDHDPENILDSGYLGYVDDGEVDLKGNFGAGFESLIAVKQTVDP